ncbi:MAG: response regulator transcription factor [Saprospiraceae bacterium]
MAGYNIVLADEHRMFVEGLRASFLELDSLNYNIVSVETTSDDLLEFISKKRIDVIVFEINFIGIDPEELISRIKEINSDAKLLVLSAYNDINLVKSCFRAGIDGYVLKSDSMKVIPEAINTIMQNRVFMGENIKVAPDLNNETEGSGLKKKLVPVDRFLIRQSMTKRELEVLELICDGKSNRKIAELLFISDHTASVHRKHILKKVGVNNSVDLVKFVEEFKII